MPALRLPLHAPIALAALIAMSLGCSASRAEDQRPDPVGLAGATRAVPSRSSGDFSAGPDSAEAGQAAHVRSAAQPPDGLYRAEVCNRSVGACRVIEVEVKGGYVEKIFLPGGHLDLDGAELAEDGSASGDAYGPDEGYTGDVWSVRIQGRENARS